MSNNRNSNSIDVTTNEADLSYPRRRWNYKKIGLIAGGVTIVVIVIVVLAVTLSGGEENPDDTTTTTTETPVKWEMELNDFLRGTLSARRFNGRWITDKEILVNQNDGLKLFDVLEETYKVLLPKVENDLLSKAYTYSLSPDNTHLFVGYDQVKGFRHSYEASYSVIELNTDDTTSKAAGKETKIYITDESDKLTLVQWSPNGQGLVIIYKNNIYYKPTLDTEAIQLTKDGSPQKFNGVPDWVYEEEVFGSNSAIQFSPDGTKLAYIQFDDTGVETFEYTYYGQPGTLEAQYPTIREITYPKVGTRNPEVKVFQVDLPTSVPADEIVPSEISVPDKLSGEEHIITTLSWANKDTVVTTWMNRVQNQAYIQVSEGTQNSVIAEVKPTDGWVELFRNPLYSEDGSQFALIMSQDQGGDAGGYRHLTLLSTDNANQIQLTKGKYVVTQLIKWDAELNYIFYSANTEDDSRVSHIYAVKAEQDAESQCLTCDLSSLTGDYKYFSVSFSNNGKIFALNALGPDVPRSDLYSYSIKDEKIELKHEREYEANNELHDKLSSMEQPLPLVEYDDQIELSSGYKAQVSMIVPGDIDRTGKTKYPVLINVYGGPDSHNVNFQWGINWGTYLAAAKNIIYVRIDGRGSALRGDKLLNEIYRKLGTVEIEDQIETAKKLAEKYSFIDRDHMAIWGWSYGGYAAGLALAKDTESVFKCAVSVAPVTDWTYYDTIYTERYMGLPTEEDNADGYETSRLSTLHEEFKGKNYFLIHGNLDDNVHYQQAMALSRTLEKNAIMFKQMSYPDEDHSLSGVQPHLYMTLEQYFSDCFNLEH